MELTNSEKKILRKIRKSVSLLYATNNYKRYDFWFTYDDNGEAIGWEGGYELPLDNQFRNQYSVEPRRQIKQNWELSPD